jgi:S1-C subfamily serine protease
VTAGGPAAVCAAALVAASAIAHATGGGGPVGPAVVAVEGWGARAATGFVVEGRVVTVAHAVAAGRVVVRGADGVARAATVVRRDEDLDLAVLAVTEPAAGARAAAGPAGFGHAGSRVVVRRAGGALSLPAAIVRRIDARVRAGDGRLVARRPALELRAPIAAGDSGAPVVGPGGRVEGVIFAGSDARAGVAYAVDARVLARLLR